MIKKAMGDVVRKLRTQNEMTQDKLSYDADITMRFLQEIEAGTKGPSLLTIFKLSKALKITPADLILPVWKAWLKGQKD